MKGLRVLSLCDGMSCGYIALDREGIKVDKYFAADVLGDGWNIDVIAWFFSGLK